METKEYTCSACHKGFSEERPEEEANAEAERLWGVPNASENPAMARICDDCFRELMGWARDDVGNN